MPNVHVHRAEDQPATKYVIWLDENKVNVTNPRRRVFYCFRCSRPRIAANLIVHVYYDGIYYFCKPGKGCKRVVR